jgi:hypothetical protein
MRGGDAALLDARRRCRTSWIRLGANSCDEIRENWCIMVDLGLWRLSRPQVLADVPQRKSQ